MPYFQCAPHDRLQRILYMLQGTVCGDMINATAAKTMAPVEMVLADLLATISAVVQTKAKVNIPLIGVVPTSLFVLIEALTNERKSAVSRYLKKALHDFERQICQERKQRAAEKAQEEEESETGGKGKKRTKPKDYPEFQLTIKNATGEATQKTYANGNWSLLQDVDEGAMIFKRLDMALYCTVWSGDRLVVNRASASSFVLEDCCLAVSAMIQPACLDGILKRKGVELLNSGFLGRTLYVRVNSTQGHRFVDPYQHEPEEYEGSTRFYERCTELLETAQHENPNGPPLRDVLVFEEGAKVMLRDFYNDMERNLGVNQVLHGVREFVGKATENAGRLAANLCHFETRQLLITHRWVAIAIELMYFFLDQARERFYRPSEFEMDQMAANELLAWIGHHTRLTQQPVSLSDLQRGGPSRLRRREVLTPVLERLLQSGHLVRYQRGNKTLFAFPMVQVPQVQLAATSQWLI